MTDKEEKYPADSVEMQLAPPKHEMKLEDIEIDDEE